MLRFSHAMPLNNANREGYSENHNRLATTSSHRSPHMAGVVHQASENIVLHANRQRTQGHAESWTCMPALC